MPGVHRFLPLLDPGCVLAGQGGQILPQGLSRQGYNDWNANREERHVAEAPIQPGYHAPRITDLQALVKVGRGGDGETDRQPGIDPAQGLCACPALDAFHNEGGDADFAHQGGGHAFQQGQPG